MKYILAGIDGTGSKTWMRADGYNSHVFRFLCDFMADRKQYWAGPGTFGFEMGGIVAEATQWVATSAVELLKSGTRQEEIRVCLVGHSRGAVAAMEVASRLKNYKSAGLNGPIRVRFVGLYDAVDRSTLSFSGADLSNVDDLSHAVRQNRRFSGSRWSFGTVDVRRGRVNEYKEFDTAHGGVGGDPGYFDDLTGVAQDTYCNALTLVLSDAELLKRYGNMAVPDPSGRDNVVLVPRYEQLKGAARDRRVEELLTRWRASWEADVWIRAAATASCGADRLAATSPHHPFLEKDVNLAPRLATALCATSLSHQ